MFVCLVFFFTSVEADMVSALKYTFTFLSFLFELLAADRYLVSGVNYILPWLRCLHFVIVLLFRFMTLLVLHSLAWTCIGDMCLCFNVLPPLSFFSVICFNLTWFIFYTWAIKHIEQLNCHLQQYLVLIHGFYLVCLARCLHEFGKLTVLGKILFYGLSSLSLI